MEEVTEQIHRLTDSNTIALKYLAFWKDANTKIEAIKQANEHGEHPSMSGFVESLREMETEGREEFISRLPALMNSRTVALADLMAENNRNLICLIKTLTE